MEAFTFLYLLTTIVVIVYNFKKVMEVTPLTIKIFFATLTIGLLWPITLGYIIWGEK